MRLPGGQQQQSVDTANQGADRRVQFMAQRCRQRPTEAAFSDSKFRASALRSFSAVSRVRLCHSYVDRRCSYTTARQHGDNACQHEDVKHRR